MTTRKKVLILLFALLLLFATLACASGGPISANPAVQTQSAIVATQSAIGGVDLSAATDEPGD